MTIKHGGIMILLIPKQVQSDEDKTKTSEDNTMRRTKQNKTLTMIWT